MKIVFDSGIPIGAFYSDMGDGDDTTMWGKQRGARDLKTDCR
jgi:hypothetical protein